MADVTITLHVNTAQIAKPNDVDNNCNFGQAANITNEDYTVSLDVGQTVEWVGVSSNAPTTDRVEITKIKDDSPGNIFGPNNRDPLGNAGNGWKPSGKVNNSARDQNETYTIFFNVYNGTTQRNGKFQIDPKLQVNG
ncbi:MAG: hypothetical protein QNK20_14265 [Aureibaculum sp.]|nr:hypothetical protein [Aureibaculum sp.]